MISQKDEGKIVLAGALADPVDSALFIWKDASREVKTGLILAGLSSFTSQSLVWFWTYEASGCSVPLNNTHPGSMLLG